MNFENLNNMVQWERQKALYLIDTAEKLGMNLERYGELAVNPNSGYTYLWLEDYNFCLYMPISCDLKRSDIYVLYTCPIDGEETEETLDYFSGLTGIENWIDEQINISETKE